MICDNYGSDNIILTNKTTHMHDSTTSAAYKMDKNGTHYKFENDDEREKGLWCVYGSHVRSVATMMMIIYTFLSKLKT